MIINLFTITYNTRATMYARRGQPRTKRTDFLRLKKKLHPIAFVVQLTYKPEQRLHHYHTIGLIRKIGNKQSPLEVRNAERKKSGSAACLHGIALAMNTRQNGLGLSAHLAFVVIPGQCAGLDLGTDL